ncbi:MAG: RidA family protein [Pseudomonadota bacterium]
MSITRLHGSAQGRCRATVYNGLVYAVATDTVGGTTVAEQTANTLSSLEQNLIDAGSDKTRIVQATVYLRDMSTKAEMDEAWCSWIGNKENWPQRACVGTDLAGDDLVEIVVTAALKES